MASTIEIVIRGAGAVAAIAAPQAIYAPALLEQEQLPSVTEAQRIGNMFGQDTSLRRLISITSTEKQINPDTNMLHLFPQGTDFSQISSQLQIPVPVLENLSASGMNINAIRQLTPEKALNLANNNGCSVYVVKKTDQNLTQIAEELHIPLNTLESWNYFSDKGFVNVDPDKDGNPNLIHAGDKLYVQDPNTCQNQDPQTTRNIANNGQADGSLLLPQIPPQALIGITVVLLLTAGGIVYYGFRKH